MNLELQNRTGVTLIEIIIVVAVIAMLATMLLGIATHIDTQSKEKATKATFALLEGALDEYKDFKNDFPGQANVDSNNAAAHSEILYGALDSIPASANILHKISDKLIQNKLNPTANPSIYEIYDPWGTVLDYRYIAGDSFPRLISAGPDRKTGIGFDGDNITNR